MDQHNSQSHAPNVQQLLVRDREGWAEWTGCELCELAGITATAKLGNNTGQKEMFENLSVAVVARPQVVGCQRQNPFGDEVKVPQSDKQHPGHNPVVVPLALTRPAESGKNAIPI